MKTELLLNKLRVVAFDIETLHVSSATASAALDRALSEIRTSVMALAAERFLNASRETKNEATSWLITH